MVCRQCGQDKVAGDFIWKPNGRIAHGQKCKSCMREIRNTPEMRDGQRDRHLQRLYGITIDDYNEWSEKQDGKCAICGEVPKATGKNARLHVDHDHATGKIRGLLCYGCNIAIGFLGEDWNRVYKLLDYLNFHSLKIGG